MITDVGAFLRYYEGVHGRTVRDVSSLPEAAERWRPPPSPDEESSWGVAQIVCHVAEARGFFASAFLGRGWVWDRWPDALDRRAEWVPALERSWQELAEAIRDAPDDALRRRVPMLDRPDRTIAAWRTLMMMSEHEVHHRSQLATYAGLNGWPVHQTFDRTNEWVVARREAQLRARDG